jgi:hypothetical protein
MRNRREFPSGQTFDRHLHTGSNLPEEPALNFQTYQARDEMRERRIFQIATEVGKNPPEVLSHRSGF